MLSVAAKVRKKSYESIFGIWLPGKNTLRLLNYLIIHLANVEQRYSEFLAI